MFLRITGRIFAQCVIYILNKFYAQILMEHLIFKHVPINNFKHEDLFIEMKKKTKTFEHKKKNV